MTDTKKIQALREAAQAVLIDYRMGLDGAREEGMIEEEEAAEGYALADRLEQALAATGNER